jgi:DNA-directed RNA polymerase specialized sigma24 family protein
VAVGNGRLDVAKLMREAAEAAVKQELAAIKNRLTALEGRKGNAGEAITDEDGSKLPQRFDPIGASTPSKAERREPPRAIPAKLRAILGPDWKAIRRHYAKTKSIKQTAANFDVPINTLKARIRREGWNK